MVMRKSNRRRAFRRGVCTMPIALRHISWLILGLLLLPCSLSAQTTLEDTFDSRTPGAADFTSASPGGLSWTVIQGGVRVEAYSGQPTTPNSRAMHWPQVNSTPQDTLVLADQVTDWNQFSLDLGWSSKYVRKTAGLVLFYKDPGNFYFLRLASLADGQLIRRRNGVEAILASGDIDPPDVGDKVPTLYRIEVDSSNAGIEFRVDRGADGTFELQHTDSSNDSISYFGVTGGRIGFRWLIDNGSYHYTWIDRVAISGSQVELDADEGISTPTATPTPTSTASSSNPTATPTPTQAGQPTPTPAASEREAPAGRVGEVVDLVSSPATLPGGYRLVFTAPDGDLDTPGQQAARAFDIRYAPAPISTDNDFLAAARLPNIPDPWPGGTQQTIQTYSLPAGSLYFRMKVIGANTSGLSNLVSASSSPGAAAWVVPANRKVGIDLGLSGQENEDFVYETLFYDRNIDDHGILYLRDDVQISLAHNSRNARPAQVWTGGTPGLTPNSSADPGSLAGGQGVIRFKFDADGLRQSGAKQAYTLNGECYGTNTYKAHRMFKAYTEPFTPKSFYDSIDPDGYSTPSERVGPNTGSDVDERYHRGYTDPDTGEEWHELGYWDDDLGWLGNKERHAQASDGRLVWMILNPKAPALSFNAGEGGRFFTTRPKGYYQARVVPPATYFSGSVTLTLSNLSPVREPIQYRLEGGSWQTSDGPIDLGTLNLEADTPTVLEMRIGNDGPVRKRTLVRDPVIATAGEEHPKLLFRSSEKADLLNRIRSNPVLSNEYKKLKTNSNQIKALMGRDYEVNERVRYFGFSGQVLSAAFIYSLEGPGTITDTAYKGSQLALKAFRSLLAAVSSYDPLGDESQAAQWAGPNGEMTLEWWDRGLGAMYSHMAYDMVAGLPEIHPIDDLKLREGFAQEAYVKTKFISDIRGNWNLKASGGLLCAAYSMPNYDSPVFGGADSTRYEGNPFTPGISWRRYVEDADLPEGQPNGPQMKSTLWDSVWEDGVSKESSSYDASGRTFLSYFLNLYANYHGVNLMESHPEFQRAFEWSLRSRFPWNRNYQSYGQARYTLIQDFHLLINHRFEQYLDLSGMRWHYDHHSPALGINPNSQEPIPFVLVWHDTNIPVEPPRSTGSRAYRNNMIFQRDYTDPKTTQLILWGRETSWANYEAHRKDDSSGIFLNAFGERFLTNSDEPADWIRSNPESQNVILVDDATPGPVNVFIPSGPSRSTIATVQASLVSPFIDYGMMATQLNSSRDQSYYRDKAQLDRHVLFPDHRFFVVLDDMKAPDGQNHTYGWTGHCFGTLDLTAPQKVQFTKASGRRLDIHFFGPDVTFENYAINMKIDWAGSEVPVPYFIAKTSGVGTQYLSVLMPLDVGEAAPAYEAVSAARGHAGRVEMGGSTYLTFCQPDPLTETTTEGLTASARFALVKSTAGELDYIFVVDHQGALAWQGTPLFSTPERRSFLYLPVDPSTGGPSVTTIAEQWSPDAN